MCWFKEKTAVAEDGRGCFPVILGEVVAARCASGLSDSRRLSRPSCLFPSWSGRWCRVAAAELSQEMHARNHDWLRHMCEPSGSQLSQSSRAQDVWLKQTDST